jgi:hypothetical protein
MDREFRVAAMTMSAAQDRGPADRTSIRASDPVARDEVAIAPAASPMVQVADRAVPMERRLRRAMGRDLASRANGSAVTVAARDRTAWTSEAPGRMTRKWPKS